MLTDVRHTAEPTVPKDNFRIPRLTPHHKTTGIGTLDEQRRLPARNSAVKRQAERTLLSVAKDEVARVLDFKSPRTDRHVERPFRIARREDGLLLVGLHDLNRGAGRRVDRDRARAEKALGRAQVELARAREREASPFRWRA